MKKCIDRFTITGKAAINLGKAPEAFGEENCAMHASRHRCWQLGILLTLGIASLHTFFENRALGQITPDATLGRESSSVTPNVNVRGLPADLIEGGAARGANLFHSFDQFNVGNGQRVYFANPVGIENILSRVTGTNPSNILGTLGVNGGANLFLLNPNGIIFGPNAKLDVAGSFVATTANSLVFENGYKFSANNPQAPPLLTVSLTPGLQYGSNQPMTTIANSGNLVAGHNLTLSGGNLDLQGQLLAGGDLTLLAQDTVKVRDSAVTSFIASAKGQLLVQGNQGVDIFALNHPKSILFSGGDMVLRSANTVGGDAHYTAAGSFRIEQLDGNLGNLFSPHDPIIRANGDVALASYRGASLHILAGGLVYIPGTVRITGSDTAANSITENITLSDGTVTSINGSAHPTLDIRAGTTAFGSPFVNTGTPTSADIVIGAVTFDPIGGDGGRVFLTNQYQPNTSLSTQFGGITVGVISTGDILGGGSVTLDARSDIALQGVIDASALDLSTLIGFFPPYTYAANGGDITFIAKGNITLNPGTAIGSFGLLGGNITLKSDAAISVAGGNTNAGIVSGSFITDAVNSIPTGGDITLVAKLIALTHGALVGTFTSGQGNAGSIKLTATDSVSLDGFARDGSPSRVISQVFSGAKGNGGNVNVTTSSFSLTNGALLGAATLGEGDAGNVTINASDWVFLDGVGSSGQSSAVGSQVYVGAQANGGKVNITTRSLSVTNGAFLSANTLGQGNAGDITINASDWVSFDGVGSNGQSSGAGSQVDSEAQGNGGKINITTRSLSVTNGAILSATTAGKGNAGDVTINASDWVSFNGAGSNGQLSAATSEVYLGAEGNGGNVNITTGSLFVTNGALLSATTAGKGNAGDVTITASDAVYFDGSGSQGLLTGAASEVSSTAEGKGGNINITAGSLWVTNGAGLSVTTKGKGDAGNVTITASDVVSFDGVGSSGFPSAAISQVFPEVQGNGGNVTITTRTLSVTNGAQLNVDTAGKGNAGTVRITASDVVSFDGVGSNGFPSNAASQVLPGAQGNGGDIEITARSLSVTNGATLIATTAGQGNAGNVMITASDAVSFDGVGSNGLPSIAASRVYPEAQGNGGNVNITARSLSLTNGAALSATTFGKGDAGNLTITVSDTVSFDGIGSNGVPSGADSEVFSGVEGNGGNINITTGSLFVTNGALLSTSTRGQGDAGNIRVNATERTLIREDARVLAATSQQSSGKGGSINITTEQLDIQDRSLVAVNSQGSGIAGDIKVTANSIRLDNQAAIKAEASSQDGGNIELTAGNLLLLRRNSQISTTAGTAQAGGNGGNITIDTDFIVAVPQENSDITANAFEGRGGRVEVTAQGLFGIEPRDRLTPLSDITASSARGPEFSGVIEINTPDVDPSRGLAELPTDVIDATQQIDRRCTPRGTASERSSFTVTGRGGLPPSPNDPLQGEAVVTNWVSIDSGVENNTPPATTTPSSSAPRQLVEAQGWVINEKGQVVLTASAPKVTPQGEWLSSPECNSLQKVKPPQS